MWGSHLDEGRGGPRSISGRKFYWRTTDPARQGVVRGRKRPHHQDSQTEEVTLIEAGAEFTATVRFDNVAPAQLGSLIAAFDPRRLWRDNTEPLVTSVGGGRPFGFGSVQVDIKLMRLQEARARYLPVPDGATPALPTLVDCVDLFATGREGRGVATSDARAVWEDIRAVLTLGRFSDDDVWYPAGDTGQPGSEEFDRSYEFFGNTMGQEKTEQNEVSKYHLVGLARSRRPPGEHYVEPHITRSRARRRAGER